MNSVLRPQCLPFKFSHLCFKCSYAVDFASSHSIIRLDIISMLSLIPSLTEIEKFVIMSIMDDVLASLTLSKVNIDIEQNHPDSSHRCFVFLNTPLTAFIIFELISFFCNVWIKVFKIFVLPFSIFFHVEYFLAGGLMTLSLFSWSFVFESS